MSLIYQSDFTSTTHQQQKAPGRRPRQLPRSPRWGADWRHAVRNLRGAVEDTVAHAQRGVPRFTPDRVGLQILDHVYQLNSRTLAVLQVVVAELVRESRK